MQVSANDWVPCLLLPCDAPHHPSAKQDPAARPSARALLQHSWITYNRRTLHSTWSRTRNTLKGGRAARSDGYASVSSVVERILLAESGGSSSAGGSGGEIEAAVPVGGAHGANGPASRADSGESTPASRPGAAPGLRSSTEPRGEGEQQESARSVRSAAAEEEEREMQEELLRVLEDDPTGARLLEWLDAEGVGASGVSTPRPRQQQAGTPRAAEEGEDSTDTPRRQEVSEVRHMALNALAPLHGPWGLSRGTSTPFAPRSHHAAACTPPIPIPTLTPTPAHAGTHTHTAV
jgi:hypothetical protein